MGRPSVAVMTARIRVAGVVQVPQLLLVPGGLDLLVLEDLEEIDSIEKIVRIAIRRIVRLHVSCRKSNPRLRQDFF